LEEAEGIVSLQVNWTLQQVEDEGYVEKVEIALGTRSVNGDQRGLLEIDRHSRFVFEREKD